MPAKKRPPKIAIDPETWAELGELIQEIKQGLRKLGDEIADLKHSYQHRRLEARR